MRRNNLNFLRTGHVRFVSASSTPYNNGNCAENVIIETIKKMHIIWRADSTVQKRLASNGE